MAPAGDEALDALDLGHQLACRRAAVDEVAQLQYPGANGLAHSGDQSLGNLAGHLSSVNRPPSTVPHGLLQDGRHFDQVIPAAGTTALFQSLGDGTDACRRCLLYTSDAADDLLCVD